MTADQPNKPTSGGEISSADRELIRKRAAELNADLEKAKAKGATQAEAGKSGGASMGSGFKYMIDLLVGVCIGTFAGWMVDKYLGTQPWGLIVLMLLGFAAGMRNMIRSAEHEQRSLPAAKRNAPSVKDDDEDR